MTMLHLWNFLNQQQTNQEVYLVENIDTPDEFLRKIVKVDTMATGDIILIPEED